MKKTVTSGKTVYGFVKKTRILWILSLVVVIIVNLNLRKDAYGIEGKLVCGKEEHVHDDACYEQRKHMQCPYENTDVAHKHDENCFLDGTLICTLDEREAHVHSEDCFQYDLVLDCEQDHEHSEDCFREEEIVACGKVEGDLHVHTDECFVEETVLTCGKREHSHSEECYEKGVHRIEEDEALLAQAKEILPGDIVYCELYESNGGRADLAWQYDKAIVIDFNDKSIINYTKGKNSVAFDTDHGIYGIFYIVDNDRTVTVDFSNYDVTQDEEGIYSSQAGCVEIYLDQLDEYQSVSTDGNVAYEGEAVACSGGVSFEDGKLSITSDGSAMIGETAVLVEGFTPLVKKIEGNDVAVEMIEGAIPETAEVTAVKLDKEEVKQIGYQSGKELRYLLEEDSLVGSRVYYEGYDIDIGLEMEGLYQVTLNTGIDAKDLAPEGTYITGVKQELYHIHDDVVEELEMEENEGNIVFSTESFSQFIVKYTVEFTYKDKVISIEGGSEILLSEIVDEDLRGSTVSFTDESLLEIVSIVDGDGIVTDWLLRSLMPFNTEEYLVIGLNDGRAISLLVTDEAVNIINDTISIKLVDGAGKVGDDYVWKVNEEYQAGHPFVFRVSYSFSTDTQSKMSWEPGQIKMYLPQHILRNRNGELADDFLMSIPYEGAPGLTDANLFVFTTDDKGTEDPEDDVIVITNRIKTDPTKIGYFEISYLTTESTFGYGDYMASGITTASDDLQATLAIHLLDDSNNVLETPEKTQVSNQIHVYMDTTAQIDSIDKMAPARYDAWNDEWGVEPDTSIPYIYLLWPVKTKITASQPFTLTLKDTFPHPSTSVLGLIPEGETMYIPGYEFSRYYEELPEGTVTRLDYVLTRLELDYYGSLLDQDGSYTVVNDVKSEVIPADGVDQPSAKQDYEPYTQKKKVYGQPGVIFNGYKYGRTKDYQLTSYMNDPSGSISELKFATGLDGNAYRYTYDDGGANTDPNLEENHIYYGRSKVKYQLHDNDLWIEYFDYNGWQEDPTNTEFNRVTQQLTKDDYRFDQITIGWTMRDGSYNPETKSFVGSNNLSEAQLAQLKQEGRVDDIIITLESDVEGVSNIVIRYVFGSGFTVENDENNYISFDKTVLRFAPAANVTGYTMSVENALYYTRIAADPLVTIKRSESGVIEEVLPHLNEADPRMELWNRVNLDAYKGDSMLYDAYRENYDEIIGDTRVSNIIKRYTERTNDTVNCRYIITWSVNMTESYVSEGVVQPIAQSSGTFYDLLPVGMEYHHGSLKVYGDGVLLDSGSYVETVETNYNNTGRGLLKVEIQVPADEYSFSYTTSSSWDSIIQLKTGNDGVFTAHNAVSYVTGNSMISALEEGGYNNGDFNDWDYVGLNDFLNDLANKGKIISTTYDCPVQVLISGTLGLDKTVRGSYDELFGKNGTTSVNSTYAYRIHFGPSDDSKAKDLVIYDVLEAFDSDSYDDTDVRSEWLGTLESVDVSLAAIAGVKPVVYYSTIPRSKMMKNKATVLNLAAELDGSPVWVQDSDYIGSLDDVTAVAVDLSKDPENKDYVLHGGKSLTVTIYMKAPAIAPKDTDETYKREAITYNEVYMDQTTTSEVDEDFTSGETKQIQQGHTEVILRIAGDLSIHKVSSSDFATKVSGVSFRLWGTSTYGTKVDMTVTTNEIGETVFSHLEMTDDGQPYYLQEVSGVDDYLVDDTVFCVEVNGKGEANITGVQGGEHTRSAIVAYVVDKDTNEVQIVLKPENSTVDTVPAAAHNGEYQISNDIRVHGDFKFFKLGYVDGFYEESGFVKNLSGAKFLLDGFSSYGNMIQMTAESDKDGFVEFKNLELGSYTVSEVKAADGYLAANSTFSLELNQDGNFTFENKSSTNNNFRFVERNTEGNEYYQIIDQPLHKMALWKVDAANKDSLSGAEFRLTGTSDYGTYTDMTAKSSLTGMVMFSDLESGTYLLTEITAPDNKAVGYVKDDTDYIVTIERTGRISVSWTDDNGNTTSVTNEFTRPDNTIMYVTTDGLDIEDTTKPGKVEFVYRYGAFMMPNKREEKGTLTVVKEWLNADGTKMTATGNNPIPKIYVYTETPTTSMGKAIMDKSKFEGVRNSIGTSNLRSFQHWTGDTPFPADQVAPNDITYEGKTWKYISEERDGFTGYIWLYNDNGNVYWYSNCRDVYLPVSCNKLFGTCRNMSVIDFTGIRADYTTDMSYMFAGDYGVGNTPANHMAVTSIIFPNNFNTSNVTNMFYMFNKCANITSLNLRGFDTAKVLKLGAMFCDCQKLYDFNISAFNTSSATDMSYMFTRMYEITSLDLSKFVTKKVTTMSNMFMQCRKLEVLDLSCFETPSLTSIKEMFAQEINYHGLKTIYVSDRWTVANVTYQERAFGGSGGSVYYTLDLVGGNGTTFNESYTGKLYARIDKEGEPGYLTYKEYPGEPSFEPITYETPTTSDDNTQPIYKESISSVVTQSGIQIDNDKKGAYYISDAGEKVYLYDQWVYDSASDLWYYNFHVWDIDGTEYNLQENNEGSLMDQWEWSNIKDSTYTKYTYGTDYSEVIQNKKKTGVTPSKGYITVTKKADEALGDREFTYNVSVGGSSYSFDLKPGGSRTISVDKNGQAYTIQEVVPTNEFDAPTSSAMEVTSTVEGDNTVYTVATGTVNIGQQINITVENHPKETTGSLAIKKVAEVADGVTDLDPEQAYRMTIKIWKDENTPLTGAYGGMYFDNNGEADVYLKNGESVLLENLPMNIHYSVTEKHYAYFDTYTKVNEEDEVQSLSATDTIVAGDNDSVQIRNHKTTNDPSGGFTLMKQLGTDATADNIDFQFVISFLNLEDKVFSYKHIAVDSTETVKTFNGSSTITILSESLKAGERLEFTGLTENSSYWISEESNDYIASFALAKKEGYDAGTINIASGSNTVIRKELATARESVEDMEHIEIVFTNSLPRYTVKVQKRDSTTNNLLEGAELKLYEVGNDTVKEVFTEANNTCESLPGTYRLVETKVPVGYAIGDEVRFRLENTGVITMIEFDEENEQWVDTEQSGNAEDVVVVMYNKPISILIQKTDINGNQLPGAFMQITKGNAIIDQGITQEEAYDLSGILELDTEYTLHESAAPVGFAKAEDIHFKIVKSDSENDIVVLKGVWNSEKEAYDYVLDPEWGDKSVIMVDQTEFVFYKQWRGPFDEPEPWQEDMTVHVTRAKGNNVDASFDLTYTIQLSDETTEGTVISTNGETQLVYAGKMTDSDQFTYYEFSIQGMELGYTYYVSEEYIDGYAPAKYYLNNRVQEGASKVGNGGIIVNQLAAYKLPFTGGKGRFIYVIPGLMLCVLVSILFIEKKRK